MANDAEKGIDALWYFCRLPLLYPFHGVLTVTSNGVIAERFVCLGLNTDGYGLAGRSSEQPQIVIPALAPDGQRCDVLGHPPDEFDVTEALHGTEHLGDFGWDGE
jgi:hypothetical protein